MLSEVGGLVPGSPLLLVELQRMVVLHFDNPAWPDITTHVRCGRETADLS